MPLPPATFLNWAFLDNIGICLYHKTRHELINRYDYNRVIYGQERQKGYTKRRSKRSWRYQKHGKLRNKRKQRALRSCRNTQTHSGGNRPLGLQTQQGGPGPAARQRRLCKKSDWGSALQPGCIPPPLLCRNNRRNPHLRPRKQVPRALYPLL